jgi:hypothetical protein
MRLPRFSSWPVALKLSLAFLAAALLPMELTAAYNLHQSLESVRRSAHLNLELFAGTTAARLDQLVTDTGRTVAQISTDMEDYSQHSILVNPAVVRAVRDEPGLRIESLGPIRLKGRAEPVDVSALHAEDAGTGTPEGLAG